jgi:hypothetical protein
VDHLERAASDRDTLVKDIEAALVEGRMLWLTDKKGRSYGVTADKVAYVEVGSGASERRVGFGLS